MDSWKWTVISALFIQLGTPTFTIEEDSACGSHMACISLQECTFQLQNRNAMSNVIFNCNHEKRKVCCPSIETSEKHKDSGLHSRINLLPNDQCGQTTATKITNGKTAAFGQYPWMALLGARLSNGTLLYICGGTLINDQYILTAAHCLNITNTTLESVRLGEHNLDTETDCDEFCTDPVQDYDIEKVISHESFDTRKLKNDIALLRLKKKVPKYTDFIKPICLPFDVKTTEKEERKYEIAGWGKTDFFDSHGSPELQFTQVYGTPLEDCSPLQPEQMQPLSESQLCAGGTLGEDACRGDSGGPLMEIHQHPKRRSAQFFQMGIVSFGAIPCGAHIAPSVYTRVSSYLNWILDHIES